jgi:hypothetical protein
MRRRGLSAAMRIGTVVAYVYLTETERGAVEHVA